jgi:hypothetical protein
MDLDRDRIAYSVREHCQLAGIGQTTVYAEFKAARLKAWLEALP